LDIGDEAADIANHPRHVLPAERLLTHGAPAGEARADADYDAAHTDEADVPADVEKGGAALLALRR
jgi:hypothetical protein